MRTDGDLKMTSDRIVFYCCCFIGFLVLLWNSYQYGYDDGRETCKKPIDMKIKPMTYKQQVKWAIWMNREREVVK